MALAKKLTINVPPDRIVRLPDSVPVGEVDILVTRHGPAERSEHPQFGGDARPGEGSWHGLVTLSDDFDEPLPPDVRRYFDGDSDPEDLLG